MAVVGVLVHAQIGDQHDVVAEIGAQVGQCHLDDPVRVPGLRPDVVLVLGNAEQHHRPDPESVKLRDLRPQGLPGVLELARHGDDGLGLVDALAHEQRRDEVGGVEPVLGHQPAKGRGPAQPTHAPLREVHAARLPSVVGCQPRAGVADQRGDQSVDGVLGGLHGDVQVVLGRGGRCGRADGRHQRRDRVGADFGH